MKPSTHHIYDKFEELYEMPLRLAIKQKRKLIDRGWVVYVYQDGETIGESYGAPPNVIKELLGEDVHGDCEEYVYGTTVLPGYRGRGIAKQLAELALIAAFPKSVCGHATSPEMRHIRERLGAIFPRPPEDNYCGTTRVAHYYESRRK